MSDERAEPKQLAVIDGKMQYTSVSAMQKADACLRQWRYKYVERLPDKPPGKGQLRGTQGHKRIQTYLQSDPKNPLNVLDPLERLGITRGLIPTPGPDLLVEEHFGKPTPLYALTVPMTGYVDLVHTRDPRWLTIRDWKFKKDLEAWGCKPEDLINPYHEAGIQMIGYAEWGRLIMESGRLPMRPLIELSHASFQTQGRADVKPSIVTVTLDDAKTKWETVSRRLIPRMELAARAPHAQDVEKDESACHRYGGCPYRATCLDRLSKLTHGFRAAHKPKKEGNEQMGLMSAVLNKPAATPAAVVGSIAAAKAISGAIYGYTTSEGTRFLKCEASTAAAVFFSDAKGNAVKLAPDAQVYEANDAGKAAFMAGAEPAPQPAAPEPRKTPKGNDALVIKDEPAADPNPPQLLPPDAPKSDPKLAAKVDVQVTTQAAESAAVQIPAVSTPAGDAPAQGANTPAGSATTAPAEEKKSKGKKKAAEPKAPDEAPIMPAAAPGRMPGLFLYFGCAPMGVATQSLSVFTETLDGLIREAAQLTCDDLRMANTRELGYGQWKGMLAKTAVDEAAERLPPGHYVVDRYDDRIACVGSALCAIAALVVRGGGQ